LHKAHRTSSDHSATAAARISAGFTTASTPSLTIYIAQLREHGHASENLMVFAGFVEHLATTRNNSRMPFGTRPHPVRLGQAKGCIEGNYLLE